MKIVVIVPTYNERETITKLIDALEEEFAMIPNHELRILIVDGRPQVLLNLSERHSPLW